MNGLTPSRIRISLYLSAGIVLFSVWLIVLFLPQRSKQENLILTIQTAGGELTGLQSTLQALPSFLSALDSTTRQRVSLAQKLYTPDELPSLLDDIHKLAVEEGLIVQEVHPPLDEYLLFTSRVIDNPDSNILSIRMVLEGRYHAYGRFLKRLEERSYFKAMVAQSMATDIDKSAERLHIETICRVLMAQPVLYPVRGKT